MSSITFREGTPRDAEQVGAVHVESWRAAYEGLLKPEQIAIHTPAERAERWRKSFQDPHALHLVAERDGRVVGFLLGRRAEDADTDPAATALVDAIYLAPDAFGTGAGKGLMQRAAEGFAARGFSEAVLWVLRDNGRARGFYEAIGWTCDGATKDCFGGVDAPAVRYRVALG